MDAREPLDEDQRIMLDVRAERPGAFERLVAVHAEAVLNFCYRQTGLRDVAEDLTQEVFLRVFRARHRYEPSARLRTWLLTIATNLVLNRRRGDARRRTQPFAADDHAEGGIARLADHRSPAAHSALERVELAERVRAAVAALPDTQRLAVDLLRFAELSYEEIAAVLGTSVPATKSLLHRAKQNLRERLARDVKDYLTESAPIPAAAPPDDGDEDRHATRRTGT